MVFWTGGKKDRIGKGFSLIELLIYVGILSVILVLVLSVYLILGRIRARNNAKLALNENARIILGRVRNSILDSSAAVLGGSCGQNTLTLTVGASSVTYRITGNVFEIVEDANPAQVLSSSSVRVGNAGTCLFVKLDNPAPSKPTVQVNLRLTYDTPGNPLTELTQDYQQTVALRQ
ncbi:prepilin-type N-terminal cleavage/methylation domain-containing protein [Candidatus Uhrbacteria bacterium]|nr:prepilin-type N-terminal cleavage/methylation domain-containing protein [Candidatus Uhrbacteria bacterium]